MDNFADLVSANSRIGTAATQEGVDSLEFAKCSIGLKVSEKPCEDLVLFANTQKMSGDQTLIKGHSSQYVKLNVGGRLYYTTIGTLTKHNDTMLSAMFSGRMEVLTDSEGW